MTNKFKTAQGVRLSRGLFYETTLEDKSTVLYTLKNEPHQGYPSLYQAYLSDEDITEYTFAVAHFDSWDHWQELCKCTWFLPYLDKWRAEKEVKLKSLALARIMSTAKYDEKQGFAANRFLLEYSQPGKTRAGRPSKQAIREAADQHFQSNKQISEDFERISQNRGIN